MEGHNLLSGGIETLNEIKDALVQLQAYQSTYQNSVKEEEKLHKSIQEYEKSVTDEINGTVKKRKQEIEDTFDKQIQRIETNKKQTENQRGKHKSRKVSERIMSETASLRDENQRIQFDSKHYFKQNHVPGFCNTRAFYALYSPGNFGDFMIILCTLIVILLIIPCAIYFGLLVDQNTAYLIMVYILTVVFFGGIYLLIGNQTKAKYPNEIRQVKEYRNQIRKNNKNIAHIKKQVRKDKDESAYGLNNYDEKLVKLNQESDEILSQKKEAISTFDHSTSKIVTSEIQALHAEKLKALQSEYDTVKEHIEQSDNNVKALTLKIAREYEPYLGKDLMSLEKLDALMNIIETGSAQTISQAIIFQKKDNNEFNV